LKEDAQVSMEKGRTECYAKWTRGVNIGSLRIGTTRNPKKEARIKPRMKGYHKEQVKRKKDEKKAQKLEIAMDQS